MQKRPGITPGELINIHFALWDHQAKSVEVAGRKMMIERNSKFGRLRGKEFTIISQNMGKKSENTEAILKARREGKLLKISWIVRNSGGYIAKIVTDDNGSLVEWLT